MDYTCCTLEELKTICDNADYALAQPILQKPASQWNSFDAQKIRERANWAKWRQKAIEEINRRNNATTNLHKG